MTSWDQELGATNKPLCVGCAVVWGAHCHAVLAVLRACACAVTLCWPRAARLRRHGPTPQLYLVRDLPAGRAGEGLTVWYVGAKSLVGDRSCTKL